MNNGIYLGNVFMPEHPERIIGSTRLKVSDEFFELEVPNIEIALSSKEILCGTFNGLGELTFVNCTVAAGQNGSGGRFLTFRAEYCLNMHFPNFDDLIFYQINAYIPSLFQWLQIHSIKSNILESEYPIFNIVKPESIEIGTVNGFSLSFIFYHSFSSLYREGQIILKEGAGLKIESSKGSNHLNELIEILISFQKLLYFITNSSCEIESINLFSNNSDSINLYSKGFKKFSPSSSYLRDFTYSNLKNDLNNIISNWFKVDKIHTSVDLVLEKSINSGLSRENFFLNGCFALETFHRNFHDYRLLSPGDFKELRKKLLQGLNVEESNFVKNKLSHFNSPNFRERLIHYKKEFDVLLPPILDTEKYIAKIVRTRNYLVHRSSKGDLFNDFDLLYAAIYLEIMVKIQVFRILGLSENSILNELQLLQERISSRYKMNEQRKIR